jgi:triple functional domain protein
MQQLLASMTRHMEKKEAFLKACTLARRTAESFMKYAHRNIMLACGIGGGSPNSTMTTSITTRSAKAVDASVKQMLEQLFVQENSVLEAWSARKKRLEHCLQYLQFDFWVKEMTEMLAAADTAVSSGVSTGSVADADVTSVSTTGSNNANDAVALLKDIVDKVRSVP